jgi:hypothetical protein
VELSPRRLARSVPNGSRNGPDTVPRGRRYIATAKGPVRRPTARRIAMQHAELSEGHAPAGHPGALLERATGHRHALR